MPQTTAKRHVPVASPSVGAGHSHAERGGAILPLVKDSRERWAPLQPPAPAPVFRGNDHRLSRDPLTGYLPGFDGLRALSILLVLVSHAGYGRIVPGGLGVAVFF